MAYNNAGMSRWVASMNTEAPISFLYDSGEDTLGAVLASGYFNEKNANRNLLPIGTLIWVNGSDVSALIQVTANSPNVTTAQLGPNSSGTFGGPVKLGYPVTLFGGIGGRIGNATLVGGTVVVPNTSMITNSVIVYSRKTIGGTTGDLSYTINPGVGFTFNSTSATETSLISYFIFDASGTPN